MEKKGLPVELHSGIWIEAKHVFINYSRSLCSCEFKTWQHGSYPRWLFVSPQALAATLARRHDDPNDPSNFRVCDLHLGEAAPDTDGCNSSDAAIITAGAWRLCTGIHAFERVDKAMCDFVVAYDSGTMYDTCVHVCMPGATKTYHN